MFGAAYIMRAAVAVCSAYSLTRDVCSQTSCETAVSRPSVVGAEAQALDRRRAVAGEREHLRALERELHRAPRHRLRGHDGEHGGRVDHALGAEAAADERGAHVDVLGLRGRTAPLIASRTACTLCVDS